MSKRPSAKAAESDWDAAQIASWKRERRQKNLAALVLVLLLTGCNQPPQSATISPTPKDTGRYHMIGDSQGNAWRWDAVSGETWKCWQGMAGMSHPSCYSMYLGAEAQGKAAPGKVLKFDAQGNLIKSKDNDPLGIR